MHSIRSQQASSRLQVDCSNCSLESICLPRGLSRREVEQLTQAVRRGNTLQKGDPLYRKGDPFQGFLAIKSGTAKIVTTDAESKEHIVDILLPGELLGFDALATDIHNCSAVALETVSFCELPANAFERLCLKVPTLFRELFRHAGKKFDDDVRLIILNKRPAEERLAAFLISLSERLQRRGFSPLSFRLSLNRQEIGSYLDLALATVSRLLRQFQDDGLLIVNHKSIQILDIEGLRKIYS